MNKKIKSGKEILDNFFDEIELIPNVNQSLANALKLLYQSGKFTDTNVSNNLAELRKEEENAED